MIKIQIIAVSLAALAAACSAASETDEKNETSSTAAYEYTDFAVLGGGCFWCVESDLEKLDGVGDVVSGYSGGVLTNPTYRNHPGHIEVVRAPFDPNVITYRELVDYFFRHIDPLDEGGQFCDRGHEYSTVIFYRNADQFGDATAAKEAAEAELGAPVVTEIRELNQFWKAEDYHQDYYKKNPVRYRVYRTSCGRDRRVKQVWDK